MQSWRRVRRKADKMDVQEILERLSKAEQIGYDIIYGETLYDISEPCYKAVFNIWKELDSLKTELERHVLIRGDVPVVKE